VGHHKDTHHKDTHPRTTDTREGTEAQVIGINTMTGGYHNEVDIFKKETHQVEDGVRRTNTHDRS
jgi:hypothetical protein